jgi:N-acylglucosamine-6-phosphate 2-epimerase
MWTASEKGEFEMEKAEVFSKIAGGLIVSCQALEDEPLHSSYIMSRMAYSAMLGGACGIRANGIDDIEAIRGVVDLPVIGIVKRVYDDSDVYITPTLKEVAEVVASGAQVVSMDATARKRPGGETLDEFVAEVRRRYPDIILMADISDFAEGKHAAELGFDIVSSTMCGYTPYTKGESLPALGLIGKLSALGEIKVIAEGGIWSPDDLKASFAAGAFAAVVGTAITRPREITRRFAQSIKK